MYCGKSAATLRGKNAGACVGDLCESVADTHRVASRRWTVGDPEQMVAPCNCIYGLVSFLATDKVTSTYSYRFPDEIFPS